MNQDNKTPEEILREVHKKLSEPNPTDWKTFEQIMSVDDGTGLAMIEAMKAYGKQEFNRAIELAAENAEVIWINSPTRVNGVYYPNAEEPVVDKESVLKLKIK